MDHDNPVLEMGSIQLEVEKSPISPTSSYVRRLHLRASPESPEYRSDRLEYSFWVRHKKLIINWIIILLISVGICLTRLANYLIFHSLVEIFASMVFFSFSMVSVVTPFKEPGDILAELGIAYPVIALSDLLHTLMYKGMGVFPSFTANEPTQQWIAGRILEGMGYVISCFVCAFLEGKWRKYRLIIWLAYYMSAIIMFTLIFTGDFAMCFDVSRGTLTPFKIAMEWCVIVCLVGSSLYLWYLRRHDKAPRSIVGLQASIIFTCLSELLFTTYSDVFGTTNMLGHITKLLSAWILAYSILKFSITQPFTMIWHELKKHTLNLEQQIEKRTAEIVSMNEELKRKTEEAVSANEAKSRFLAVMSHELRTPLVGIIGATSLLSRELNEKQRELSDITTNSAQLLLDFVGNVLDLAKIENDSFEVDYNSYSPRDVITHVQRILTGVSVGKCIQIEGYTDDDVPSCLLGDPDRIKQILLNFGSNAVKFTNQGGVTVRALLANENMIRYQVKDTGSGLPAELSDIVFLPFSDIDKKLKRGKDHLMGAGIGLSVCKQLTDALKGKVGFHSEPDKGSTFWIDLPIVLGDITQTISPVASDISVDDNMVFRVLIVEDNPVNQRVIKMLVKKANFECDVVDNGLMALQAIKADHSVYSLVFMDVMMPEMDGLEASLAIRKFEQEARLPRIPIVALTACVLEEEKKRCLLSGMDSFLSKPVTLATIRDELYRWRVNSNEK